MEGSSRFRSISPESLPKSVDEVNANRPKDASKADLEIFQKPSKRKLRAYKNSGQLRNKLDLFIIENYCKHLSTGKIAKRLMRQKSLKRISRKAIDLRLKRLDNKATEYHLKLRAEEEAHKIAIRNQPPKVILKKKAA